MILHTGKKQSQAPGPGCLPRLHPQMSGDGHCLWILFRMDSHMAAEIGEGPMGCPAEPGTHKCPAAVLNASDATTLLGKNQ